MAERWRGGGGALAYEESGPHRPSPSPNAGRGGASPDGDASVIFETTRRPRCRYRLHCAFKAPPRPALGEGDGGEGQPVYRCEGLSLAGDSPPTWRKLRHARRTAAPPR